jgi:hypothetical protein
MGRVLLALDPHIDRKIALKVMAPLAKSGVRAEEQLRQRFVMEARAAGMLSHPGIVGVYDAATDPKTGLAYIAMEWVKGKSLEDCIEQSGLLGASRVMAIGEQVAMALDTAHRRGLIHRDIKPGNILLDENGQAKVTDFGIAKFASMSLTATGQLLGSPRFMSPEQVRNESIDGRSDLFSLGAVLYQCSTGVVPFDGESLASITYKILEIDPKPPQSVNPSLSMALARVIERALAKAPEDRFQTGEEFARALLSGDPDAVEEGQRAGTLRPAASRATGTGTVLLSDQASQREATADRGAESIEESPAAAERTAIPEQHRLIGKGAKPGRARWAAVSTRAWSGLVVLAIASALLVVLVFRTPERDLLPEGGSSPSGVELPEKAAPSEQPRMAVTEARRSPTPASQATLEVLYNNRLKAAYVSIWIDGTESWARTVAGPKKLLARASGEDVRAKVAVGEGTHTIEVRVTGRSGRVYASERIDAVFSQGQTRRLRATLIPPKELLLRWKG